MIRSIVGGLLKPKRGTTSAMKRGFNAGNKITIFVDEKEYQVGGD
jgi:hypothetical protein